MCYAAGEVNATGPVLLVPKDSDDSNDSGRYDGEADMYDDLLESDEHVLERYFGIPICDSDEGSYGGNEDDGNARGRQIAEGSPDRLKAAARTPQRPDPTLEEAFIALIEQSRNDPEGREARAA